MKFTKRINRKIIAPILFNSKVTELINRFSCNSKLILNYHGIVKIFSPELSKNHLPIEEFVELKNRTSFSINLKNWSFSTATSTKKLP